MKVQGRSNITPPAKVNMKANDLKGINRSYLLSLGVENVKVDTAIPGGFPVWCEADFPSQEL